ncbi:competence type IV pilus assembly protein ComGB [Sporolactobacillus laevolacticus]|uniref:Type II secretion system protein GspF domain-containing protein n=1 Tax=Sporolactobacillus laevolacticus DSM 442 TaxID=1395513 RepID=V6IVB7_9BACL|nr:competence type IV pilus assembly protein ComGB [Sporolactobacillus laevolacticus]EST11087.1 hypothetical protein P343_13895 [Sporolactobacillus laevolacticus DSM 442]
MFFQRSWTKKDQAQLLIDIGRCLSDGYPLITALSLPENRKRPKVQEDMERMRQSMIAGSPLHEVLHALHFPGEIASSIYFAETGGNLSAALIESGTMILRREQYKETMRRFMRYPLFLIWVLCTIMFVIGRFLLPSFIQLYRSLSLELPLITKALLYLSEHVAEAAVIAVVIGFALALCVIYYRKLPLLPRLRFTSRLPIIGRYIRLYHTHLFAFHLGSLLSSGLNIKQSIHILTEKGTSPFLKSEAERMEQNLLNGLPLDSFVLGPVYYLPELAEAIHQGQRHSLLGKVLCQFSMQLMKRMEQQSKWLISMCQPLMLILVGGFVLMLFLSILLPIFHMINAL